MMNAGGWKGAGRPPWSGGWSARTLKGDEIGAARPDILRSSRTDDERRCYPDGFLGSERLTLHRHRLREGTAIGVVRVAEGLDVRDAGAGVVPTKVEERRVGEGKPESPAQEEGGEECGSETDGDGGHGCNLSGRPCPDNPRWDRGRPSAGLAFERRNGIFNVSTYLSRPMRTRISKWGNSLAVRLPKPFMDELGLVEGDEVEITLKDGRLVLTGLHREYGLEELVSGITAENRHRESDWGRPQGREGW
jgi:antitoxin MazE